MPSGFEELQKCIAAKRCFLNDVAACVDPDDIKDVLSDVDAKDGGGIESCCATSL